MARAAALKLIGDGEDEESGESLFVSTLIRRASVAPPGE
jgi:LacI family transcriptional regulator